MKKVVLTGDRPTGSLHLGHYVGSLSQRLILQEKYEQFIMIADSQALTDNFANPAKVKTAVMEVALDYLAVGLDPNKTSIFIQSTIPELPELGFYFLNLVSLARLLRNPTVKEEAKAKGYGENLPAGFLCYPISQAADITAFKAELVPVGVDQLPMIEQTNELVKKFNQLYRCEVLKPVQPILAAGKDEQRLVGLDGQSKMSKSLGNAILLLDDSASVKRKVMGMFTDPLHIKVEYPGRVENNPVFTYLRIFGEDKAKVQALSDHYRKGGLGDVKVKSYLYEVLENFLEPIRNRRKQLSENLDFVQQVLRAGQEKAQNRAAATLLEVKKAIGINYFA